jgi:tetratricopeptide (TPR) repeat protein
MPFFDQQLGDVPSAGSGPAYSPPTGAGETGTMTLAVLCVFVALLVQSGPNPEYALALQDAEAFFNRGDYNGAIAILGPWAARFPNSADLRHNLGLAYYRQQDFAKAAEHLTAAVGLEKENSPAWRQSVEVLGVSLYFCSRPMDAVRYLERAAAWVPDSSSFLYTLAMSYAGAHDLEHARALFAKLYRVNPDTAASYVLLADILRGTRQFTDAESVLSETRRRWPSLPDLDYREGVLAFETGRSEAAIHLLLSELGRDPGHAAAWQYLGEAYVQTAQVAEAAEALQRAIWLDPALVKAYVRLAEIYADQSKYSLAENTVKQALRLAPQDYKANVLLARIYQKTNRPGEAKVQMSIAKKARQGSQSK